MSVFTCDSCKFIFKADNIPDHCPSCKIKTVTRNTDSSKKIVLPSVRLATESELAAYLRSFEIIAEEQGYIERLEKVDEYSLSIDEHNLALILLYRFKSYPNNGMKKSFLNDLLLPRNDFVQQKMAVTMCRNIYNDSVKLFTSDIGKERRETENNDIRKVSEITAPDSASNTLMHFKWDDEFKELIGDSPNLGNIRRIDTNIIAEAPSDEYQRFLTDWYNSL